MQTGAYKYKPSHVIVNCKVNATQRTGKILSSAWKLDAQQDFSLFEGVGEIVLVVEHYLLFTLTKALLGIPC